MPFFSLRASKVAPLVNGVHREYLDSMVQVIRNGGLSPSCTSKVLVICGSLVERQYASKVTCSQFKGTPLSSTFNARVSESRTLICIRLLRDAALANMASNKKPVARNAILRILIRPTPPNTADACVAYPVFSNDSGSRSRRFGTFCSPGVPRTIAFPAGGGFGRTDPAASHRPSGIRPPFFGGRCPQSALATSVIRPSPRRARFWARWGGGFGLERKDRPELGAVILPFVGWTSSNCV